MSQQQMLQNILETVQFLKVEVTTLKEDVSSLKGDVGFLKENVDFLRENMVSKEELKSELELTKLELRQEIKFSKEELKDELRGEMREMENRLMNHIEGFALKQNNFEVELVALASGYRRHDDIIRGIGKHVGFPIS